MALTKTASRRVREPGNLRLNRRLFAGVLLIAALAPSLACDSLYYKTMRKFGVEKRDLLVKRVRETRKSQEETKEQIQTALERFRTVIEVDGGKLEEKYETLNRELERSESRARDLRNHIKDVKDVSGDLFKEWRKELDQYNDRALRAASERELAETRRRAAAMIAAMERAEKMVEPVLRPLRDRVLFLKHNLNALAIGALSKELVQVRGNVDLLVKELEKSIAEADAFIKEMTAADATAS
jgi:hypothetical protein